MEKNLIGELISKIRKEKEWTQKDLAMKLNVSDKTVSKWETGHGIPDIGSLETIAEALEISVGELLAGKRFPEENLLKSSDEVLVKTMKTSKKKMYKVLIGVFVAALLFVFILLGMIFYEYHLADTVNPADEEAFRKYALSAVKECYGTNENTEILGIKKKEMYIAVVFRDENGCYMIHFEQDKIFENRYHVSGAEGTKLGRLGSSHFKKEPYPVVLVVFGCNLPENAAYYKLNTESEQNVIVPIENHQAFEIHLLHDTYDLGGWPVLLDENYNEIEAYKNRFEL